MDNVPGAFACIVQEQRMAYQAEAERLKADDRLDEANLLKVRMNICGVVEALASSVFQKETDNANAAETVAERCAALFAKMDGLAEVWRTRLELARQHQDFQTLAVGEAKLDAMAQCKRRMQACLREDLEVNA